MPAVLLALLLTACSISTKPPHREIVIVEPATGQNVPRAVGEILPRQEGNIYAQREGVVEAITVNLGDRVTERQIIATLLPDRLQSTLAAELQFKERERTIAEQRQQLESQQLQKLSQALRTSSERREEQAQRILEGEIQVIAAERKEKAKGLENAIFALLEASTQLLYTRSDVLQDFGAHESFDYYRRKEVYYTSQPEAQAFERSLQELNRNIRGSGEATVLPHLEAALALGREAHLLAQNLIPSPELSVDQVHMIRQELEDATTALTTLSTDYRSLESSLAALEKRRGKQVTDLEERLAEIAARQGHTELTIASIDADMDRIRRQMGIGRSVRAPFSGVITRRYVNAGSSVHVDQPLVMITDDSQRFIRFSASEEDALSLEEGMTVEFVPTITRSEPPMVLLSLEGTPALERTRATISRIAQAVDPTTRTIQVEAEIDPGAGNNPLLTHMRVLVSLPLSHDPALVTIPERALEQSLGDHIVWTLNPKGDPEARSVLVKFLQGGKAYIERGLYAGERVIVRSAEPPKRGWKLLSHWLPHATVDASHALQSPSLLSPPARWTIARTVERLRARQTSTLQGGEE